MQDNDATTAMSSRTADRDDPGDHLARLYAEAERGAGGLPGFSGARPHGNGTGSLRLRT